MENLADAVAAVAAAAANPAVTEDEATTALQLVPPVRVALDDAERRLLAVLKLHKSWAQIAVLLRLGSAQGAQQYDRRLRERSH